MCIRDRGVALGVMVLCVLLAFRLARHLVEPINQIDLDRPMVDETYAELAPLVSRIQEQNRTIRHQMDELSQRQREFTALTDNMSEGFLLVDYKTNVLASNHSALRLLTEGKDVQVENLRRDGCLPQMLTTVEAALAGVRTDTVQEIGGVSWQIIANPVAVSYTHLTPGPIRWSMTSTTPSGAGPFSSATATGCWWSIPRPCR